MLIANKLISYITEGDKKTVERIIWLDEDSDIGYVIDINSNHFPYLKSISDIENRLKQGSIIYEEFDPHARIIDEVDISEKHLKIRDDAWNTIKEIVELEPLIYESSSRKELILNISNKSNLHESTIIRYLKRYWKNGKNKNALLPNYYKCGGKGKERQSSEIKRGRPRIHGNIIGNGVNVTENTKKIFKRAINKYYYNSSKKTLSLAYELMLKEYFSDEIKIENNIKSSILKSYDEIPTLSQFRYWFQKERNLKKEVSTRKGLKRYEQNHRSIIGESTSESIGPGSVYQIDATIGDVYLVSRFNRNWIIGRPVVYAIIDTFSRLIVGVSVSLEGPSWIGAMDALLNTTMNKMEYCQGYGIDIEQEMWPANNLPDTILADRGELEGSKIESLISNLGIKVQNTPSYRAELKGIVEQHFRVTNLRTKAFLPGAVNAEFRGRGDRDYRLDAKLDIYQFTQIIIKSVLYHNNHHYLENYNRDSIMIEDDVEPIPVKLWEWGIVNKSGKLRYVAEDIVKLNLMPSENATVTARGIKFKGMLYGSKLSLRERWFEKARNQGSWKIKISYDPRRMDYIYIKDEDGFGFEKCFLLDHEHKYKNRTIEEIEYLRAYEKLQEKKYTEIRLQSKVDLISEIEGIVKDGEDQTKGEQVNLESERSRIKNIRENRKIEKLLQREEKGFELEKNDLSMESQVVPIKSNGTQEENDDLGLNLLIKKQQEALKKIHGK